LFSLVLREDSKIRPNPAHIPLKVFEAFYPNFQSSPKTSMYSIKNPGSQNVAEFHRNIHIAQFEQDNTIYIGWEMDKNIPPT